MLCIRFRFSLRPTDEPPVQTVERVRRETTGTGEKTAFDHQKVLKESDDLMRSLFFSIVKETTGTEFWEGLSEVYNLSEKFHRSQNSSDFEALAERMSSLTNEEALMLASAFSNVLNLHNISEHVAAAMEVRTTPTLPLTQQPRDAPPVRASTPMNHAVSAG